VSKNIGVSEKAKRSPLILGRPVNKEAKDKTGLQYQPEIVLKEKRSGGLRRKEDHPYGKSR